MAEEIHLQDIGTKFLVTVKDGTVIVDISSATTKDIIFQKPNGTSITKPGIFETDGTDGKIYYSAVAGDLNASGKWSIQANIELATGNWKSSISKFTVYKNL